MAEGDEEDATDAWWHRVPPKPTALVAGVALFLLLLALPPPEGMSEQAWRVAAVAVLMSVWWVFEAIPIYATALVPLAAFPLLGVRPATPTAAAYANPTVFLFLGGFLLAAAMQKWHLHRRIALYAIRVTGKSPKRILLGFMVATAVMSMFVSNTATALMVYPIALAVAGRLGEAEEAGGMRTALMLGVAYAATVGGIGTLIGTPPNAILAGQAAILHPELPEISFARWMLVGVPFAIVFLPLAWAWLVFLHARGRTTATADPESPVDEEIARLGRPARGEVGVFLVFCLAVVGWVFRADLDLGFAILPGWADAVGRGPFVHDATVAVVAALLLFVVPVRMRPPEFLLDWETAVRIPWGVLLLFGGGFALATGFEATGLAAWIGERMGGLGGLPLPLLILAVALVASFASELISNTALAAILIPVLSGLAVAIDVHPYLLMIPATIGASAAFMMPVGTPPNAIVFGSGYLRVSQMARAGIVLNLVGAFVTLAIVYLIAVPLLGLR